MKDKYKKWGPSILPSIITAILTFIIGLLMARLTN